MRVWRRLGTGILALAFFGMGGAAHAASDGCTAVNSGAFDYKVGVNALAGGSNLTSALAFNAGETLSITVTQVSGGIYTLVITDLAAGAIALTAATSANGQIVTGSYTIPAAGSRQFDLVASSASVHDVMVTCGQATDSSQKSSVSTVQQRLMSVATVQTAGMISARIGKFSQGAAGSGAAAGQLGRDQRGPAPTRAVAARPGLLDWSGGGGAAAGGEPGLSAGNEDLKFGAWANFNWTSFGDNSEAANSDGGLFVGVAGADYATDRWLFGAALTFEWVEMDTNFNAGRVSQFGIGISPYLAYRISDWLSADVALGYGRFSGDADRRAGGVSTGALIRGDYNGDRYFATANLNATPSWGDFTLGGGIGVLWAQQWTGEFVESDGTVVDTSGAELGRLSLTVRPSYLVYLYKIDARPTFIEPYGIATYSYDWTLEKVNSGATQTTHPNDRNELILGAGFDFYSGQTFSANVEASSEVIRDEQRQTTITGTVRVNF